MATSVVAILALFEFVKHWQLYSAVVSSLGLHWGYEMYQSRSELLRAVVSTGQPIPLGYVMAVAIGFYLFIQREIPHVLTRRLGFVLLMGGLVAPLSRGPWLGALALIVIFIATGPYAVRRLFALAIAGGLALPLLTVLPGGQAVINLLPFVGTVEVENIEYRHRLIDTALAVIDRSPWFGSVNFAMTPEMQSMIQGTGIIDIVNTYLLLALEYGYVGAGLFVAFFVFVAWGILQGFRQQDNKESDEYRLGRSLLATLLSILLMIFTVSPITVIPIVFWSVAAMGVAYASMVRSQVMSRNNPVSGE
jgi:O-antigen ligase